MELDIGALSRQAIEIRALLAEEGYRVQTVLLFGSHAQGSARSNSDIDLAFVSRDFGVDAFVENTLVNRLLFRRISSSEGVAVSLKEYLDPFPVSPIVWEIKKKGVALF